MKKSELILRTDNKDLSISWLFVWAKFRSSLTIHQMRLVIRILEFCQRDPNGIGYRDNHRCLEYQNDDVVLKMPVSDVYFSDFSLQTIRDDLANLHEMTIEFYDYEKKVWRACGIIEKPEVLENIGTVQFKVDLRFWSQLRIMAHGIRHCELNKLVMLRTVYAMWFYMLISQRSGTISITIANLKERLGIDKDDYKGKNGRDRIDHLEERVIKPAQKALNESCPWTFRYKKNRVNPDNKRSPVTSLTFIPVSQPKFRDEKLEKKALITKTSSSILFPEVDAYMKNTMGFKPEEINPNKETLDKAVKTIPNIMEFLCKLQSRRRKPDGKIMPMGWVINALKSEMKLIEEDQVQPNKNIVTSNTIGNLFDMNKIL